MRKSKIFLLLIVIMLLINVASAMVSDIVITPKNPVVGDDITIKARTDQSNELIKIIFEKKVPVENGKYSFEIRRLNIPMESCFVATAKDVTTLKAKVTWWIAQVTKNGNLEGNGVTRLSQCHVPPLTYNIKIDGSTEKKSQVLLQFSASSNLPANKGKIEYRYDSQGMPTGDYLVKIGDVTKTLTLRDEKEKDKERDEKEKDKDRDERETHEKENPKIKGNDNSGNTDTGDMAVSEEKEDSKASNPVSAGTGETQRNDENQNTLQIWKNPLFYQIFPRLIFR